MKDRTKILTSPLFILGLGLLLFNDFYLKAEFSNWLTGKLSDVSGLFIFPLFLTVIFPRFKRACFIGTAVLFIFWKTPFSTPVIDEINGIGIPVERTVDFTDLWTLFILPIAFAYERSKYAVWNLKPKVLIFISAFSFVATTLPPREGKKYTEINKTYEFNFSRQVLIDRLNRLTAEKLTKQPRDAEIIYDSDGDLFYYDWKDDTLAIFIDSKRLTDGDTIKYWTELADFLIQGNDSVSSLKFINAYKVVPAFSDKDYREKAIKEFEKRVIKKIKN
jgi:hypothetical protein